LITDQFVLCTVFCQEIKWIDAPILICDLTADNIVDIVAVTTFTGYGVHSQRMLGNLAQYSRLAFSQSDLHKLGSIDGRSANRLSHN